MPEPHIAILGTGIMGGHMARRLVTAGLPVTAWNRTQAKAAATGAQPAPSPSAALAAADLAIVMLSDAATVEEILFTQGAAAHLRPGATLIVMSSLPVEACRSHAARVPQGVAYIDAPVSGGEAGARNGTLAILCGGDPAPIAAAEPVLRHLGRPTRIGPVGSGQLAKLANQVIVGGTMVAVAEALHLAQSGGADPAALQQALLGGFAESTILREHGLRMVQANFVPGGPAKYQLKDLRTAAAQAGANGIRPTLLPLLMDLFAELDAAGDGDLDVSAIFNQVLRRSANDTVMAGLVPATHAVQPAPAPFAGDARFQHHDECHNPRPDCPA